MGTSKTDMILSEVRDLRAETIKIGQKVAGIEQNIYNINRRVNQHDDKIQRALDGVDDNKIRLAKYLGASFSGGGIVGLILFLRSLI